MDISGRLAALQKMHKELEVKIEKFMTHPSADNLEITGLKREKLYIKEQILRLTQMNREVA